MKSKHILFILFSVNLAACGDDGSAVSSNGAPSGNDASIDRAQIAALSHGKCDNAYLTNSFHVLGTNDSVEISKNCLFEEFTCGAVGYIDSDVDMKQAGFADVVIVALEQPLGSSHCLPKGKYRCTFDTRIETGYLQLACNPE